MTKFSIFWLVCHVWIVSSATDYSYVTKYLDVPLDHFGFTTNKTFKLRYLINDKYWEEDGPIFLYAGNEGDITLFAENTGFIFDIAPHFNALIVFAEHRYYGTTLPFGNQSFSSPQYLGYLSSSQALSDYVYLLDYLQNQKTGLYLQKSPVVVFGGSYGGMLAAWMRMKYPASVVGAIAASAPIYQFSDIVPCDDFNRILTDVFKYSVNDFDCSSAIRSSWTVIRDQFKKNTTELSKQMKLCNTLKKPEELIDWLTDMYGSLGMANYPYPNSFLAPLPGHPVRGFCSRLKGANPANQTQFIKHLSYAVELYTNYTGKIKCNDISASPDSGLGMQGWDFQACTEIIMPMCSTDKDMFELAPWNFKQFADDCAKQFGVRPVRQDLAVLEYGGRDISAASNIVFSNGLLDPWSGGGVLNNISNTVVAIVIPEGAHHLDLRGSNPADPPSVIRARTFHVSNINKWIKDFYNLNNIFYRNDGVGYLKVINQNSL